VREAIVSALDASHSIHAQSAGTGLPGTAAGTEQPAWRPANTEQESALESLILRCAQCMDCWAGTAHPRQLWDHGAPWQARGSPGKAMAVGGSSAGSAMEQLRLQLDTIVYAAPAGLPPMPVGAAAQGAWGELLPWLVAQPTASWWRVSPGWRRGHESAGGASSGRPPAPTSASLPCPAQPVAHPRPKAGISGSLRRRASGEATRAGAEGAACLPAGAPLAPPARGPPRSSGPRAAGPFLHGLRLAGAPQPASSPGPLRLQASAASSCLCSPNACEYLLCPLLHVYRV